MRSKPSVRPFKPNASSSSRCFCEYEGGVIGRWSLTAHKCAAVRGATSAKPAPAGDSACQAHSTSCTGCQAHSTSCTGCQAHSTSCTACQAHSTSCTACQAHSRSCTTCQAHSTSCTACQAHSTSCTACQAHSTSCTAHHDHCRGWGGAEVVRNALHRAMQQM